MRKIFNHETGFTLIELLVVIAIISVLTAAGAASFLGVRARTRDAQRKSDLHQIQSALELYRAAAGFYPLGVTFGSGSSISYNGNTYMQPVPNDPQNNPSYKYTGGTAVTDASGNTIGYRTYTVTACLENKNDSEQDATKGTCTNAAYSVNNP